MGCGGSKENKKHSTYDLNNKKKNTLSKINDSLLNEYSIDKKYDILNNEKKLNHLIEICQYSQIVELKNITFVDASFFTLINKIRVNNKIERLILKNIEFEGKTEFIAHLANALSDKKTLKNIKFISLINSGKKLAKAFVKLLQSCENIEKITLVELEFDDEDSEFIGSLLYENYINLKNLKMSGIFLKEKLEYFFDGLSKNTNIKTLSLQKMNLGGSEISLLLNSLKNNNMLNSLNISNNPIGDSVIKFSEDENYLNSIHTLKLNNCDINDENINILLNGLALNKSIKVIELNNNQISNDSRDCFVKFFKLNQGVETIYLLKNKISQREISASFSNSDLIKMVLEL